MGFLNKQSIDFSKVLIVEPLSHDFGITKKLFKCAMCQVSRVKQGERYFHMRFLKLDA